MSTPLRILILEDEPNDAELQAATLEQFGYACEWRRIETRAEFSAGLAASDHDVVLVDYNLPGFDGLTALELFRERGLDIPIILVSGTLGEEQAIETLKAGATDYVLKNRLSRLGPVVERALRETEERRHAKRAEKALAEKTLHLDNILRSSTEYAIVTTDLDFRITYYNPRAEVLFGHPAEEVVGRTVPEIHSLEGVEPERFHRAVDNVRRRGEQRYTVNRVTDKGSQYLEARVSGVYDPGGRLVGYALFAHDVTHRTQLESQLRQAQKMEAIGTLAGGIAHDFNNLLQMIIGCSELARSTILKGSEADRALADLETSWARAAALVARILAFSRQSEDERRPMQVQPVLEEALKMLRQTIPVTIAIRRHVATDCGGVPADPTQVHQIVMNLCTNAYQAMGERGTLEVDLREVHLDADLAAGYADLEPGRYARLTVSDTGCGMDEATIERIFEPYFTTKGVGEGTGLGLAVTHEIVRSHHGAVAVASTPGEGSTFAVLLPICAEEQSADEAVHEAPDALAGSERVLLVDDEAAVVDVGRALLERLGYEIVPFTSSTVALEVFRQDPAGFDVVVTDRTMPDLTGVQLAEELIRIRPDIPIILCTGFSETSHEEQAREVGIREFLMKPVVAGDLARVIRRVVAQSAAKEC
ncbi:MAG: response regulator [bacterium]|nr:response regulator [bacterium]